MIHYRWFIALFLTLALALPSPAADAKRPNILWIIAEDMGPELACYGTKEVWTPVLDKLAQDGMSFRALTQRRRSVRRAGRRSIPACIRSRSAPQSSLASWRRFQPA